MGAIKANAGSEVSGVDFGAGINTGADLEISIEGVNNEGGEIDLIPLQIGSSEILEERKAIDNVIGLEGELIISKAAETIINIDINGNLIISDLYADSFSINDQGELIQER